MLDPRKDPRRRCMPLAEWPRGDREAWEAACRQGDPFGERGLAAHWRPKTCNKVVETWGRFLTSLHGRGNLDPKVQPEDRVGVQNLRAFQAEMEEQDISSVTLAQRFTDLGEAMRVMVPGYDVSLLRHASQTLKARAKPVRDKRARYVHPMRLLQLGLDLMEGAEDQPGRRGVRRASRYRDGLIIAFLAAFGPRRRNITVMEIGVHLIKMGDIYAIRLEGHEMKGHRPYEASLPELLTPYIDRYLDDWRVVLLKGRVSRRLWLSEHASDLAEISIYFRVMKHTKDRLGVALSFHDFRSGPATSLAIEDPEHVGAASAILGHADERMRERSYNQAQMIDSVRRYQDGIGALRKSFRKTKLKMRKR